MDSCKVAKTKRVYMKLEQYLRTVIISVLFSERKTIILITNDLNQTKFVNAFFKQIYEEIPDWLKPKLISSDRRKITFFKNPTVFLILHKEHWLRGLDCSKLSFMHDDKDIEKGNRLSLFSNRNVVDKITL